MYEYVYCVCVNRVVDGLRLLTSRKFIFVELNKNNYALDSISKLLKIYHLFIIKDAEKSPLHPYIIQNTIIN